MLVYIKCDNFNAVFTDIQLVLFSLGYKWCMGETTPIYFPHDYVVLYIHRLDKYLTIMEHSEHNTSNERTINDFYSMDWLEG